MIPLAEPSLDGNEAKYLQECIDSGFVSSVGPFVERFERRFAKAVGAKHAVACSSGTAALHVALRLTGAEPGRLVAVSDFTFIASANAISYTGADLLLVDSEPNTWNMDTQLLHDQVVRRARVGERIPDIVEVVHILGHPAEMEPLLALRDRFGIRIVEDAAESLGASWTTGACAGRQVGTVGDFGCFSFNGNKIITTGGGGMIVTDNQELASRARHLTTQARLSSADYMHDTIGYNYRLTNVAAALGVAQLERLDALIDAKRCIAQRYTTLFRDLPVKLPPVVDWAESTYWLYTILLDAPSEANDIVSTLMNHQIQTRRLWCPMHTQPPYCKAERLRGEICLTLYKKGISLPSAPGQDTETELAVATILCNVLAGRI